MEDKGHLRVSLRYLAGLGENVLAVNRIYIDNHLSRYVLPYVSPTVTYVGVRSTAREHTTHMQMFAGLSPVSIGHRKELIYGLILFSE